MAGFAPLYISTIKRVLYIGTFFHLFFFFVFCFLFFLLKERKKVKEALVVKKGGAAKPEPPPTRMDAHSPGGAKLVEVRMAKATTRLK